MNITRPIPQEAMEAVAAILKEHKEPLSHWSETLILPDRGPRYLVVDGENTVLACPVGLSTHDSDSYVPDVGSWLADDSDLEGASTASVQAFVDWWDEQTDIKAAEAAIWGTP